MCFDVDGDGYDAFCWDVGDVDDVVIVEYGYGY